MAKQKVPKIPKLSSADKATLRRIMKKVRAIGLAERAAKKAVLEQKV